MSTNAELTIYKGTTWKQTITYTDSNGVAVDITGFTVKMNVKYGYKTTDELVTSLSTSTGEITLVGSSGQINLELDYTVTADLPQGTFVYDLILIDTATSPETVTFLLQDKILIKPLVTSA